MRTPYEPSRQDLDLATILYALSDPIRLRIVSQLAAVGEQACGTFDLPVAKSTLSHHMKTLREAGVTQTRLDGLQRFLSLRRRDLDARFPGLLDAVIRVVQADGAMPAVLEGSGTATVA